MDARKNRQWRLVQRPRGPMRGDEFELHEASVPEPGDGEILVRNLVLSCEPTQLGWMTADTYLPAVPLGEVMRAIAAGEVVASRNPRFQPGQLVQGLFGWQDYAIARDDGPYPILPISQACPLESALSVLGNTGMTAYFGMMDVGRPRSGETVVVSAAAGATGSVASQLAKLSGCRVVGIAGGPDKCRYLTDELGLDAAIDYKSENLMTRLRQTCPSGVDVYFDNVGGRTLDAVLLFLALHGRIVICGAISSYADAAPAAGPRNYLRLLRQRGRMEGFNFLDYAPRASEALDALEGLYRAGQLKDRVDVQHGFEQAPRCLVRLFAGENLGKQLVRIAPPGTP